MQILRLIKRHFKKIEREDLRILFKSCVTLHLEYCVQAWSPFLVKDIKCLEQVQRKSSPFLVKDIKCLEQVQRRSTKLVDELDPVDYTQRLKIIGLQSLENRRLRGDVIKTFKIITGKEKVNASDFFKFSEGIY